MSKETTVVIIFKSGAKVSIAVPDASEFVKLAGKFMRERLLVNPIPKSYPYQYNVGCIDLADVSFIAVGAGVYKIYEDQ